MDAGERALFDDAVRRAATGSAGDELDRSLDEIGWRDALAADRRVAVSVLFDAAGAANATTSALEWLLADALGQPDAAVVLPRLREVGAPVRSDGATFVVEGLGTSALGRADRVTVVRADFGGHVGAVVPTVSLTRRPIEGLDPALGLFEVCGAVDAEGWTPVPWDDALAIGQLALAHQLVASGRAMLELARTHALERVQFDRPIATFQAVRHRLAETLVALDAAQALLDASWDEGAPELCAMAKALAGRSARTAARHCQQVLAGIGFTAEHPLHRFVRRTIVLDQLLGAGSVLTRDLGSEMLERRSTPASLPL